MTEPEQGSRSQGQKHEVWRQTELALLRKHGTLGKLFNLLSQFANWGQDLPSLNLSTKGHNVGSASHSGQRKLPRDGRYLFHHHY